MNTIQLECFVAVAEHLNFSRASQVLKITQPAVSHQIQSLEEELGYKLFRRTSKSVALTSEGILFLPDARLILKTALSAKERLGIRETFLPFELGCHNSMEMNLLPPVLQKLMEAFPKLRPSVHLVPFPSLFGMVENRQIHAVLGIKEEQKAHSLMFQELASAPMACICFPGHPLAAFPSLHVSQLSGSFISCSPRQIPDPVFALQSGMMANLPLEQRYLTEGIESALTLVKARVGYTVYPDIVPARETGLLYIPITGLPRLSFGVYSRHDQDHPAFKRFLSLFMECLQENQDAAGPSVPEPAGTGGV